jgi:hypothetical protein
MSHFHISRLVWISILSSYSYFYSHSFQSESLLIVHLTCYVLSDISFQSHIHLIKVKYEIAASSRLSDATALLKELQLLRSW